MYNAIALHYITLHYALILTIKNPIMSYIRYSKEQETEMDLNVQS